MHATEHISLHTTPQAKAIIEKASELMGVSMSHFILTTMYEKSLNLIQNSQEVLQITNTDVESWELSDHDNELVKILLDNPPTANNDLKQLLTLSRDVVDLT